MSEVLGSRHWVSITLRNRGAMHNIRFMLLPGATIIHQDQNLVTAIDALVNHLHLPIRILL